MQKLKSTKALAIAIFASSVFDLIGGFYFILLVGTDRNITHPPTHPFYAILIGLFLLCFAYLQFMSAIHIKRCLFNIGVVILSRVFYGILFFSYFLFVEDFPNEFLPTAIADVVWVILYTLLALLNNQIRLRDLFFPDISNDI